MLILNYTARSLYYGLQFGTHYLVTAGSSATSLKIEETQWLPWNTYTVLQQTSCVRTTFGN